MSITNLVPDIIHKKVLGYTDKIIPRSDKPIFIRTVICSNTGDGTGGTVTHYLFTYDNIPGLETNYHHILVELHAYTSEQACTCVRADIKTTLIPTLLAYEPIHFNSTASLYPYFAAGWKPPIKYLGLNITANNPAEIRTVFSPNTNLETYDSSATILSIPADVITLPELLLKVNFNNII